MEQPQPQRRADEVRPALSSAPPPERSHRRLRTLGLGLITGAADDDCSAIGTYASAGAKFGPPMLWTAPVVLPMMFTVVYVAGKLGQVSGRGLFQAIRDFMPRWVLYSALVLVTAGNTIEAAANLGGMAAALNLFVPVPIPAIVVVVGLLILAVQLWAPYTLIRDLFRWLALSLLLYVAAALLAKPDPLEVLRGTFVPTIRFDTEFLALLVAIIGTSLSAYIYAWKSNEEVEEEIAQGRTTVEAREGATAKELRQMRRDVFLGMLFANIVMYFIILSTASTLYPAGREVNSAADAADALRPVAGDAAGILFATGLIAAGFLAVPVLTAGAAYSVVQSFGWRYTLHARLHEARGFYLTIFAVTFTAVALNFLGFNPIRALVWAGIVQGISTPPLLLLIMLMTGSRKIMGTRANTWPIKVLGWGTTVVIFSASCFFVASWFV